MVDENENKIVYWKLITGFFAFAIPVAIAIYFGFKSYNLEQEKYSLDYMPKVKYAGRLFFTEYHIGPDTTKIKKFQKLYVDSTRGIGYPANIFVRFNLKLTNIGVATANWKRPIISDRYSNNEDFANRDLLLNKDNFSQLTGFVDDAQINELKEIATNDTINLSVPKTIYNLDTNETTTIHLLFLYTGDNNVLYDTYMWVHLKFVKEFSIAMHNDSRTIDKFIQADVVCCESKIYTEEEKKLVYKKMGFKD